MAKNYPLDVRAAYVQGCTFAAFIDDGQTDSDERQLLIEIAASCHINEDTVNGYIAAIDALSKVERDDSLAELVPVVKAAKLGERFLEDFERVLTVKSAAKVDAYRILDDLGRRLTGEEDWRKRVRLLNNPSGGVDVRMYVQSLKAIRSGNVYARKFFLAENWRLGVRYCRMAFGWTRNMVVDSYWTAVEWWCSPKIVHYRLECCEFLDCNNNDIQVGGGIIGVVLILIGYWFFLCSIWGWLWDLSFLQWLLFVWLLNLIGIVLGAVGAGYAGFGVGVGLAICVCKVCVWLVRPLPEGNFPGHRPKWNEKKSMS